MDKSYKEDIPKYKATLRHLRREFSRLNTSTDWATLRIDPLIKHVTRLERLLSSPEFAREHSRLRNGVAMFRSDLVYLRANIKALKDRLAAEKPKAAPSAGINPARKRSRSSKTAKVRTK